MEETLGSRRNTALFNGIEPAGRPDRFLKPVRSLFNDDE